MKMAKTEKEVSASKRWLDEWKWMCPEILEGEMNDRIQINVV